MATQAAGIFFAANSTQVLEHSVALVTSLFEDSTGAFSYHKPLFPLNWAQDGIAFTLAGLASVIAASGGIGGGGLLVPIFVLLLRFRLKHAVALSNIMVLGGAIASMAVNARRRHPRHSQKPLIDWDLVLVMEPATMAGAMIGSLLSKILPSIVITVPLIIVLFLLGSKSLKHGLKLWAEESRGAGGGSRGPVARLRTQSALMGDAAVCLTTTTASEPPTPTAKINRDGHTARLPVKIGGLTLCLVVACLLTILRGGGAAKSPLGVECGTWQYWALYIACFPWVLGYALLVRQMLLQETEQKTLEGHMFEDDEVAWTPRSTLKYASLSSLAGLFAGLFGVGGGILKGPLMLEMGVRPVVASATAAAMILFTTSAASISFITFGMLDKQYGLACFTLGIVCTGIGQAITGRLIHGRGRQSVVVISIGAIIILSALLVGFDTMTAPASTDLAISGVCG